MSNISSDMNKPCWKLVKACPQSQKLFCCRENNLLVMQLLNLVGNSTCKKKHVSYELDTEQGEGITEKLKFAAKQLNERIQLYTSGVSGEFSELPTTFEHDQTLENQSDEFPASPQAMTSFLQVNNESVLLPTLKIM